MVAEEVRGKGKRGLLRIIFGRTTFFILFMALQIAVLAWIYFWLDDRYQAYGYGAFGLVSAVLAIRILNEKQNASFKMAWETISFRIFWRSLRQQNGSYSWNILSSSGERCGTVSLRSWRKRRRPEWMCASSMME